MLGSIPSAALSGYPMATATSLPVAPAVKSGTAELSKSSGHWVNLLPSFVMEEREIKHSEGVEAQHRQCQQLFTVREGTEGERTGGLPGGDGWMKAFYCAVKLVPLCSPHAVWRHLLQSAWWILETEAHLRWCQEPHGARACKGPPRVSRVCPLPGLEVPYADTRMHENHEMALATFAGCGLPSEVHTETSILHCCDPVPKHRYCTVLEMQRYFSY